MGGFARDWFWTIGEAKVSDYVSARRIASITSSPDDPSIACHLSMKSRIARDTE